MIKKKMNNYKTTTTMTTFILFLLSLLPFAILIGVLIHSVNYAKSRHFQHS